MFRSQDHHGARFDTLARDQAEVVLSQQSIQNHEDLQHGVVSADAAARPSPEGQMGEGGVTLLVHFGESFLIETLRGLPVPRRMVRAVDEHNHRRASRYIDTACAVVRESHAVDHPEWWIKAQRLQDHLSRKLELRNV